MGGISRNQAGRLLGVSARTISRMVERGELTQDEEGKFSREEIEEWKELKDEETQGSESGQALSAFKDVLALQMENNQALLKLLEGPHNSLLTTLTKTNEALMGRVAGMESHYLSTLEMLGELFSLKSESRAAEINAESKAKVVQETAPLMKVALARILDKTMGPKKPAPTPPSAEHTETIPAPPAGPEVSESALVKFFHSLSPNQRAMLVGAAPMITDGDPEQTQLFMSAMRELGFQIDGVEV